MSLSRRNPHPVPSFARMFDDFFGSDFFDVSPFSTTSTSVPAVNVKENDDAFIVEVAAPGMTREDFKIELNHNRLTISSEKKAEHADRDEEGRFTRREFSYQHFSRSFTLPDTVAGENISAAYTDGLLKLTLPKKEEAKPKPVRVIEIS